MSHWGGTGCTSWLVGRSDSIVGPVVCDEVYGFKFELAREGLRDFVIPQAKLAARLVFHVMVEQHVAKAWKTF